MKSKFAVLAFALLCSLVFANSAKATCAQDLTNYFSQYVTQSTNSAGTQITQSVNLTGYSTFNGDPNCQMPFPEIHHMPQVFNQVGTAGGWTYSSQIYCATCYMSLGSSVTIPATPGTEFIDEFGGEIDCNVAGIFFTFPTSILSIEVAYTRSLNTGILVGTKTVNGQLQSIWRILPYCTATTSPPDWNPITYGAPADLSYTAVYFVDSIAACTRINLTGQPWFCISPPGASIGWPQSLNLLPANCTHNP